MERKSLTSTLDTKTGAVELGEDFEPKPEDIKVDNQWFRVRLSNNVTTLLEGVSEKLTEAKVKTPVIEAICDIVNDAAVPIYLSFTVRNQDGVLHPTLTWKRQMRQRNGYRDVDTPHACWLQVYERKTGMLRPMARIDTISDTYGAMTKLKELYQVWRAERIKQEGTVEAPGGAAQDFSASENFDEAPPIHSDDPPLS